MALTGFVFQSGSNTGFACFNTVQMPLKLSSNAEFMRFLDSGCAMFLLLDLADKGITVNALMLGNLLPMRVRGYASR